MPHRKLWRWPVTVRKMSVFINMHDSKDAQDFRWLTCHIMQALEKIFHLFFGIFYGGTNFLLSLQNLTMKEAVSVFHKQNNCHLKWAVIEILYEMRWFCRYIISVNDPAAVPFGSPARWMDFILSTSVRSPLKMFLEKDHMNMKVQPWRSFPSSMVQHNDSLYHAYTWD